MKQLLVTIGLSLQSIVAFCQCNCQDHDQGNGTTYRICAPVIVGTDSINSLEIGFSKLEHSTFLHMTVSRKGNPGIVNSMLTIHRSDGTEFGNVMVQRDTTSVDGMGRGSALFFLEDTPFQLETGGIKAVSFKLDDKDVLCPVTFLAGTVAAQGECLP